MEKIVEKAIFANLAKILNFIQTAISKAGFIGESSSDILLAAEEILVNIISYAYGKDTGDVEVRIEPVISGKKGVIITFIDSGVHFDVLKYSEPDLEMSIEERHVGGLGIHLVKSVVDKISYKRENNQNILCFEKYIA